jgi:DNA-binding ferritin-like protein
MSTVIIVLALLAIGVGTVIYLTKKSIIKDSDGDLIPDVVEEKIQKAEAVIEKTKEAIEEIKEVADSLTTKPKYRKNKKAAANK